MVSAASLSGVITAALCAWASADGGLARAQPRPRACIATSTAPWLSLAWSTSSCGLIPGEERASWHKATGEWRCDTSGEAASALDAFERCYGISTVSKRRDGYVSVLGEGFGGVCVVNGRVPTCQYSSSPSTFDQTPRNIASINLGNGVTGCTWFCKCSACFQCSNDQKEKVDVLARIELDGAVNQLPQMSSEAKKFVASRFDEASKLSCSAGTSIATSSLPQLAEKVEQQTRNEERTLGDSRFWVRRLVNFESEPKFQALKARYQTEAQKEMKLAIEIANRDCDKLAAYNHNNGWTDSRLAELYDSFPQALDDAKQRDLAKWEVIWRAWYSHLPSAVRQAAYARSKQGWDFNNFFGQMQIDSTTSGLKPGNPKGVKCPHLQLDIRGHKGRIGRTGYHFVRLRYYVVLGTFSANTDLSSRPLIYSGVTASLHDSAPIERMHFANAGYHDCHNWAVGIRRAQRWQERYGSMTPDCLKVLIDKLKANLGEVEPVVRSMLSNLRFAVAAELAGSSGP